MSPLVIDSKLRENILSGRQSVENVKSFNPTSPIKHEIHHIRQQTEEMPADQRSEIMYGGHKVQS